MTPGYFSTLGIAFREGRAFERGEADAGNGVVILSAAAAERYWPGESALGRVLHRGGDPEDVLIVVGVADNVKIWSLGEAPRPYMYLPFRGGFTGEFHVVTRGSVPAGELAAIARDEVRSVDADLFLSEVRTLEGHLGYVYFLPRMAATLLSLIGGLALILACMGLYGMVSYGVSRRTREMGIRMALGAERGAVVALVLRSGLVLVAIGGALGMAASLGFGALVEGFLFGIGGTDPLALLAAPAVLALVAVLAAYVPARRASRVDPVRALRSE